MQNSDIIKKHNFSFNKKFGQNFIFDQNLLQAIVGDSDCETYGNVLEIGTGAATLTRQISLKAKKVLSYEIDKNLQPIIYENLQNCDNCNVVFKDVMKENVADIEDYFKEPYVMIANLPYYITTPIIFKFVNEAVNLKQLVIMVQKEVAERIVAMPGSKEYGAISAQLGVVANCKITRVVSRKMFMPEPNVDSAILKITFVDKDYNIKNKQLLQKVIASAFSMRRKTLANNLKNSFSLNSEQINSILLNLQLPQSIRGECLSADKFVELYREIEKLI